MTSFDDYFKKKTPVRPAGQFKVSTGPASPYANQALTAEAQAVAGAPEGTRNDTLNRAGFNVAQLVAAGELGHEQAWQTLTQAALHAGLDITETTRTLMSAFNAGQQQPRVVPEPPPPVDAPEVPAFEPGETDDAESAAAAFWGARPILRYTHDFARSRRCAPWAVLGVLLARVAATVPPWVTLPPLIGGKASLNLFVALVGASGSGKGAAERVAAEMLNVGPVELGSVGSGEGIVHRYAHRETVGESKGEIVMDRTSVLFTVPEIDTMTALGQRNGATLLSELRKAWSGERLGFDYADSLKRITLSEHSYRLCMVLGVQPGRANALLEDSDGGTPQRFVWLPTADPDAPEEVPPEPEAPEFRPQRWTGYALPLPLPQKAVQEVHSAHLARLRGEGEALDGHALLCREKVAAALTVLDTRRVITEEDWELAGTVMRVSDRTRQRVVDHQMREAGKANVARAKAEAQREIVKESTVAESAVSRVARNLLAKLQRAGEMTRKEVGNTTTSRDRPWLDDALEALITAGQVDVEELPRGRRFRIRR